MLLIGETINESSAMVGQSPVSLFLRLCLPSHGPTSIFSLSFEAHLEMAGSRRQITRLAEAGDQQRDYLWIKTKIKDVDFCSDGKQAPCLIQFTTLGCCATSLKAGGC